MKKGYALIFTIISMVLLSLTVNSENIKHPFTISLIFILTDNNSSNIEIIPNSPNGDNPLNFTFNISYNDASNLNCTFEILEDKMSNDTENKIITYDFSNGEYNWTLNCTDTNISITDVASAFTINEGFSTSLSKEVYLLDGEGNLIGGNGELQISSAKVSDINIKIQKPSLSSLSYSKNSTTNHQININKSIVTEKGTYNITTTFHRLAEPITMTNEFYVAEANLTFNKKETGIGEEIKITADLYSPSKKINSVIIDFGDGNANISYASTEFNTKKIDFFHEYDESDDYTITLTISIDGKQFAISKNGISVEGNEDTKSPTVSMLYPENKANISSETITLRYKAEDNVKIKNCTLELYNYSGVVGTLDYTKTNENLNNNQEVSISLTDFKEGRYSWYVYCCDNSSNCNAFSTYNREFKVDFNSTTTASEISYNRKEDVNGLISKIDSFIEKQESYSADEKEILNELGISKDLEYYRKRLNQIDQDLGYNIQFIEDETLKEKRINELNSEIDKIKENIPLNMRILEKKEFVKNSLTKNMQEIVEEYISAKEIKAEKATIKRLAELNTEIQNYLVVSTEAEKIEIDYSGFIKELTLITKKVDLKNNTFNTLLEIVPKEIIENASEATFITPSVVLKEDPIFELSVDDLQDEKIVYYINKHIDLEKIQETDTIIFKEFAVTAKITGFFIFDIDLNNWVYYIVLIFFLLIAAGLVWYCLKNRRILKWKKEENVKRTFSYIREANSALERKDIEAAKEKYRKIKEIFPLLPEACRKYLQKRIDKIRIEVDKKEIFALVKEFETAKRENRKEDAEILYKNVNMIYKRLPKKYQKRIYERMFSNKSPD